MVPQRFSLCWISKVLIEYKPLHQYPLNYLTFCLIVKHHLLNVYLLYILIYIYICTYKFDSIKFS